MAYVHCDSASTAVLWRSRPADGVLWVRLDGGPAQGLECPILLCACYLPPAGSPACPRDTAGWWAALAADWAEAAAVGAPLLAGDLNARTATLPDWPEGDEGWPPRRSRDGTANGHGQDLLAFCQATGARLCNGRLPGRQGAAPTSFGVSSRGRTVVDYFVASPTVWPQLARLRVSAGHPAALLSDHAALLLTLAPTTAAAASPQGAAVAAAAAAATQQQPQPPTSTVSQRATQHLQRPQFRLDEQRLEAATAAIAAAEEALAEARLTAEAATSPAAVDAAAALFGEVVCSALQGAGMRRAGGTGGCR